MRIKAQIPLESVFLKLILDCMEEQFSMVAKTFFGLEEVLAKELLQLGAQKIETGVRSVTFVGDKGFLYKANLCLRTAIRVLKPVGVVHARSDNAFYEVMFNFPWEDFLGVDQTFMFDVTLNSDYFNHSLFVAQKAKDALADRFRKLKGRRPSVSLDTPDMRFHLYVHQDRCEIALDASGAALNQRGYRSATNIAPINEALAAGMLLLTGWDGQSDFIDPMCGSATIPIEAAMIACNIPANINRNHFAFERWPDWDEELYLKIEASALNKIRGFDYQILGYDKAPSAIRKGQQNIVNARLEDFITLKQADFFKTQKTSDMPLQLLFNPPYGERLAIDMEIFYKNIGDTLKQSYPGTEAWFLTANLEALKHVGLRTSRKIKLFNGPLECRLVKYEMYSGSKKISKQKN